MFNVPKLRFFIVLFSLLCNYIVGVSQNCAEIKASGLVYCDNNDVVELRAETSKGSCETVGNTIEWYSSAAINVPLSTGCDFVTPQLQGNIKYFVRDNTDQSQVITDQVGFDFNDPSLTNPNSLQFDGNVRTQFIPTKDFILNSFEAQIASWNGQTPTFLLIEVRNYTDPTQDSIYTIDVSTSANYIDGEVLSFDLGYNFTAFDEYDVSFAANGIQVFAYEGTAGATVDYDGALGSILDVTSAGTEFSRMNNIDGFGPFFNWEVQAELGAGCPRKEVNIVQRCLEICDDNIDNDGDGEVDEACEAFSCNGRLLQSISDKLFEMSVSPVVFTEINDFPFGINSMGYNPQDNKVYAQIKSGVDEAKIVRIAGNGDFQVLDELITRDGVELQDGFSADIGSDGIYYFLDNATDILWGFELVTLTEVSRTQLNLGSAIADITYNPETGNIFGIPSRNTKSLVEIDPITGDITTYPDMQFFDVNGNTLTKSNGGSVGGIYFQPNGNIIGYGSLVGGTNQQNDMIQIDLDTYRNTGEVLVLSANNSMVASQNDAASCPYSVAVEKVASVETITAGDTMEYSINVINNTGFTINNANFSDLIPEVLTITEVTRNDFGNSNIEPNTGVGTRSLEMNGINIFTGENIVTFNVKVKEEICVDQIINNQAFVSNLPGALGSTTLSDNPNTPEEQDATPVNLIGDYKPTAPVLSSNSPICEDDSLMISAITTFPNSIKWFHENNGYTSQAISDTIINTVLSDAGSYFAFIDTANCQSDTIELPVVINPLPIASINPIGTFCMGDSIPLNASSSIASSNFLWILNTDSLSDINIENPLAFSKNRVIHTVEVTTPSGCKDTTDITIEAEVLPEVSVSNDISICLGESATLTASGANTYLWTDDIELNANTGAVVTTTPTMDREYKVVGSTLNGCLDSAIVTITVVGLPELVDIPNVKLCEGDSTLLQTSGADIYEWSPLNALEINGSGDSAFAKPISDMEYQVIGRNTFGCSDTISVNVMVATVPELILDNEMVEICNGEEGVFQASGADSLYTWSPAIGLNSTNTAGVVSSNSSGITYQVVGFNSGGCSDTVEAKLIVLENPIPTVQISNAGNICIGESLNFEIEDSDNLGSSPTYNWFLVDGANRTLEGTDSSLELSNVTENVSVILEATSSLNCVDPINTVAISNLETSIIHLFPDLAISGVDTLCQNSPVTLVVTDNNNIATNYIWKDLVSDEVFNNNTNTLNLVNLVRDREIQVFASENGCSDSLDIQLDPINVFVSIDADETSVFAGEEVELSVETNGNSISGSSDNETLEFDWEIGQSTRQLTLLDSTIFIVEASRGGCFSRDSILIKVLQGLNAPYFFSPNNDNNNDLWIIEELDTYNDTRINIFNRWGSKIIEIDNQQNTWDGKFSNGEDVPEGVYFYVIEGEVNGEKVSLTGYVTLTR